ncbi:hypothetical protein CFE70_008739 [Pyrenophora teres f. teres 0-1]
MSTNLWLPFWLNILLLTCAIPTVLLLPVTKQTPAILSTPHGIISHAHLEEESGPLLETTNPSPDRYTTAFETHTSIVQSITHSAGYMLSAKALVNFTLLAIVVPRIIRASMATKTVHGSEIRLNILGAEVSIIVSVLGVLCVAMAAKFWMMLTALIIYALGSALPVFTMSLVKSPLIALAHSDIQDFSIVMLTKTLGSLVGAPLMAVLWVQAIKIGGVGLGLPYFVSAVSSHSIEDGEKS